MSDTVIRVAGLGKKYQIGTARDKSDGLRHALEDGVRRFGRKLRGRPDPKPVNKDFWALKDVSFEVKRGECIGVIGRNGAGKSTLLKILSRITEPTTGEVGLKGRVGSLLEVGTGFHPELTGRENIFLNGAVLGMKRSEITRKFDEIVAFSEVEKFLDTPVKYYSSGMYMRLAFAVAAHLEPEILIVDEVLAVGDAEFQKKCLGKMDEVSKEGRTILFVSHNMAAVQSLCAMGVMLERGAIKMVGSSSDVVRAYMSTSQHANGQFNAIGRHFPPKEIEITGAWLERNGRRIESLLFGEAAILILKLNVKELVKVSVELILRQQDGLPVAFCPSGLALGWEVYPGLGEQTVRCMLPEARYASGQYTVDLIIAMTGVKFIDYIESGLSFTIDSTAIGERNWLFTQNRGQGYSVWDVRYFLDEAGRS